MTLHSLERLIADHQRIMALATTLSRALGDPAVAAHALRQMADALLDELLPHLDIEDCDIYPQLLTADDDATARAARDAIHRFEHLAAAWAAWGRQWSEAAIVRDRAGFAEATAAMMADLGARVRSENELLYPLALQSAAIRLRA